MPHHSVLHCQPVSQKGEKGGERTNEKERKLPTYGLRGGEVLLLLLLVLLPLIGLRGLRLLEILRTTFRGLGDPEDDDLPRLAAGPLPLLGDTDLERERKGLRIGERLRLRSGDLLGGLRARLGGERRLKGRGERLRIGLPRILRGEALAGDLCRRGGEDGERPLGGEAGRRLGGVSPRR